MTGLPGHVGGFAATITTPLGGASTHVMASGRDYNHPKTNGMLAQTGRLGNWVRRKIDGLSCSAAPVVRRKEKRPPHLLKNGPKAGYFDYAAFGKYKSVTRRRAAPAEPPPAEQAAEVANPLDAVKFLRSSKTLPSEVDAATLTALALEHANGDAVAERSLIMALLLNQLPGLDIDRTGPDRDIIKPDGKKIRETMARYRERVSDLEIRLGELRDAHSEDHLIADLQDEIDRCNGCIEILDGALSKIQRLGKKSEDPAFWSANLWKRWRKFHPDDNLFDVVSKHRDLDDIAKHYRFVFIPQERCLLEMRIAVEELLDIYRSKVLTSEQFAQLVEALACGWPSVKEDSESERPERRADAAGCVRALAQLANRGRLPRDVLARFPAFDAINRALLHRAQTRSVTELYKAQRELHALDGTGTAKGKGKEKETDDPERQQLGARITMLKEDIATIVPEFDRDADLTAMLPEERRKLVATVKENGTKLAALYGELLEASRNLAVVGIAVGDVRVDEYYIHGLDRVAPKLHKQAALMLARVALIEAEIAKINPKFQRHVDDKSGNGKKSGDEISRRMELDTLLRLGLTRDDLLDMDLSDDQLDVIHKLGELGFRNAGEVKLQNRMHRKIRNRIFNTNAGRSIARSAFGLTTAQLAREYLDVVFRAVTGNSRKFDHQAEDPEVRQAMKKRWREIMTLTMETQNAITAANRRIEKKRRSIFRSIVKLDDNPDDALRKSIQEKHDEVVYNFLSLADLLTPQQRRFAAAMIRAAVLSARPAAIGGDKPHHEYIDVYDASRHREKIIEILQSWGMDVKLFASMIDYFVFTRADNSELSPGTVTARRLVDWKKAFQPEEIFAADASSREEREVRRRSWKDRAKALARDGVEFAASHFSGKSFHDMDPAFVDQIIATLPSMPAHEKISLRTHTLVQGGFSFSTGHGVKLPLAAAVGDQTGIIIKRMSRDIHVRLVSGGVGSGHLGIGMEGTVGAAAIGGTGSLAGIKWDTEGVALRFTVADENGRENFEHVQSYLRSLLTGKLPSTEEWAAAASEWYATRKTGGTAKDVLSVGAVVGASVDVPALGTVSAGVGLDGARERAHRVRSANHNNAMSTSTVSKTTDMTTWSVAANVGASVGMEHTAGSGISEVGAAAVKGKNIAGASAGLFEMKYANVSFYDNPETGWDWDFVVDIGNVESAKEALARCGPGFYEHLEPLLDRTTTLDNGEEMPFGKALDQLLKMLRFNDGFLLQFVARPALRREVARRMRRIAQIEQQILPMMEPTAAFKEEIAGHMHFIAQAKDRSNLTNYQLAGAMIIPMLFQQNDMTVLDVMGMLKVTHVGVRLQDVIGAWIPAPQEKSDRERAEALLLGEARLSTIAS